MKLVNILKEARDLKFKIDMSPEQFEKLSYKIEPDRDREGVPKRVHEESPDETWEIYNGNIYHIIKNNGTRFEWRNKQQKLHREIGPAFYNEEDDFHVLYWIRDGKILREVILYLDDESVFEYFYPSGKGSGEPLTEKEKDELIKSREKDPKKLKPKKRFAKSKKPENDQERQEQEWEELTTADYDDHRSPHEVYKDILESIKKGRNPFGVPKEAFYARNGSDGHSWYWDDKELYFTENGPKVKWLKDKRLHRMGGPALYDGSKKEYWTHGREYEKNQRQDYINDTIAEQLEDIVSNAIDEGKTPPWVPPQAEFEEIGGSSSGYLWSWGPDDDKTAFFFQKNPWIAFKWLKAIDGETKLHNLYGPALLYKNLKYDGQGRPRRDSSFEKEYYINGQKLERRKFYEKVGMSPGQKIDFPGEGVADNLPHYDNPEWEKRRIKGPLVNKLDRDTQESGALVWDPEDLYWQDEEGNIYDRDPGPDIKAYVDVRDPEDHWKKTMMAQRAKKKGMKMSEALEEGIIGGQSYGRPEGPSAANAHHWSKYPKSSDTGGPAGKKGKKYPHESGPDDDFEIGAIMADEGEDEEFEDLPEHISIKEFFKFTQPARDNTSIPNPAQGQGMGAMGAYGKDPRDPATYESDIDDDQDIDDWIEDSDGRMDMYGSRRQVKVKDKWDNPEQVNTGKSKGFAKTESLSLKNILRGKK